MADIFGDWGPRPDGAELIGLPTTDSFATIQRNAAPYRNTRLELAHTHSMRFARIFGFSAAIDETNADGADSGFRFEVGAKITFAADGRRPVRGGLSWLFCKVRAYSSNAIVTEPARISIGIPIFGISVRCNGRGRALLGARHPVSDMTAWSYNSNRAMIRGDYRHVGEWATGWLPTLGGRASEVDEPGGGRIVACLIKPPVADPRGGHEGARSMKRTQHGARIAQILAALRVAVVFNSCLRHMCATADALTRATPRIRERRMNEWGFRKFGPHLGGFPLELRRDV